MANLYQAAKELENAPNIRDAAAAVGEIGQACSGCHGELDGGPKYDPKSIPAPIWSEDTHSMLGNNDEAFLRGAKSLAEEPLPSAGPEKPESSRGQMWPRKMQQVRKIGFSRRVFPLRITIRTSTRSTPRGCIALS